MDSYREKRVLVTGGLGFIGSNLCLRLVQLGADVTVIDSLAPGGSGDRQNIDPIAGKVKLIKADIGDGDRVGPALSRIDTVFNLVAEASHDWSMEHPERHLTTGSQMAFLQECARRRRGIRVVYAGSRQVYGNPGRLPVNESHPIAPVDFDGVQNHAAEESHLMLTRLRLLDAVVLRLSNVYGPRIAVSANCGSVLPSFFLRLMLGEPVEVFGDGSRLRDPLYVDDAVTALLRAGAEASLKSRIYNVGGCEPLAIEEIARILCKLAGAPAPVFRPFSPDNAYIDIGNFFADSTLIRRELGWVPVTPFEEGAAATLQFFRTHVANYRSPQTRFLPKRAGAP